MSDRGKQVEKGSGKKGSLYQPMNKANFEPVSTSIEAILSKVRSDTLRSVEEIGPNGSKWLQHLQKVCPKPSRQPRQPISLSEKLNLDCQTKVTQLWEKRAM